MNQNIALYYTNSKPITQKNIENALIKSGLRKRDIIMVHSDIGSFGKLGDVKDKNEFLNSILNAFINVIGKEGTLIVPTYTDSFCKNKIFDIKETKSEVGLFSEFVRKQKDAIRSQDPIFSHAGIGKNAEKLLKNISNKCLGKDSFFDRFYKSGGKIINFGKFFDITFLHYVENNFKVNYRFNKKFFGTLIKEDKTKQKVEVIFYVRYLPEDGRNVEYYMPFLGNELEKRGLLKRVPLGGEYVLCSKAKDCYDTGIEMLKKNQYAFLKNNPHELKLDNLPFYTGVLKSSKNKGLPLKLPLILKFNNNFGLIVQKYSKDTEIFLEKAYKKGSSISTNLGKGNFGKRRADDMLKNLLPICEKPLINTSFLEIGCADGYLLHRLKLLGAKEVIGCEPGPMALEGKKKFDINIINDFYRPKLIKNKFDVIFSYGVVEHINNPLSFLKFKKRILKKNGKIFVAVPNCERKLNLGDISILSHEHWNYFTKKSIKNLLIKCGLSDVNSVIGKNQAVIYAWGKNFKEKQKIINSSDEDLFYRFCAKVRSNLILLQKRINALEQKGKILGLYGGGLNTIWLLNHKLEPRFFNSDIAQQGKYYPGFKNKIENPVNLLKNKVDELWIMAIDYDKEIRNFLTYKLHIPKDIKLISLKELLERGNQNE